MALPLIPAEVVEKAQHGAFVELKDLPSEKITPVQRLHKTVVPVHVLAHGLSWLWDIQDQLTCISCLLSFMATRVEHRETRDLIVYGQIVIKLVRKHRSCGWMAYDSLFG